MTHNTITLALHGIAYSVPAFQVEGGFGNDVPYISLLLQTKRQVLEEGVDFLGRTGLGSHRHFPSATNQEQMLQESIFFPGWAW